MRGKIFPLLLAFFSLSIAHAKAPDHTGVMVMNARAPASLEGARVGVAYATIMNHGAKAVTITALSSPVAKTVEFHEHVHENGVMKMRRVASPRISPGGTMVLKPGGLHFMLIGLTAPLTEGQKFPLTITFNSGETVSTEFTTQKPDLQAGAESPMQQGHDHQH
ncbi:MAG: copper chaperone PCu(A)C [Alphaproteobacteria bacterium]